LRGDDHGRHAPGDGSKRVLPERSGFAEVFDMRLWKRGVVAWFATMAILASPGVDTTAQTSPAKTARASGSPAATRSLVPPAGTLIAPGTAPDVTLLYSGNVIGYVEPCG
jgi:hypothetical protein